MTKHPSAWPSVAAHPATSMMYAVSEHNSPLAQEMIATMTDDELSALRHHCEEIINMVENRFEEKAQEGR